MKYYYKISDELTGYIDSPCALSAAKNAVESALSTYACLNEKFVGVVVRELCESEVSMVYVEKENLPAQKTINNRKTEACLQDILGDHRLFRNWGYGTYRLEILGKTVESYGKKPLGVINPHHFQPDQQANTEEEITNWKLACEKWDQAMLGIETLVHEMKKEVQDSEK